MPVSLHAAFVPSCQQLLAATLRVLDKAEAFCTERGVDPATLLDRRLIDDMYPFAYQVKSMAVHSQGAIEGVRRGEFNPDLAAPPATMAGLRDRLTGALDALAGVDPAEMEAWIGRPMRFAMGDFVMPFVAEQFLFSFSQPNFYFHATTAYDLLRAEGVPIGKRDFVGQPRLAA